MPDPEHAASVYEVRDLEDLIVECLRQVEEAGDAAVEPLLSRHPERRQAVLEALARLGIGISTPPERLGPIGPYRLVRMLGRGGMGEVYLAEQEHPVRRQVAVKRIRHEAWTPQVKARFEFERQALAMLAHDGIARIFDAGTTASGDPYFVMEYVEGEPITTYCDRHGLGPRRRAALMIQACDAVAHAHQRGVLHRDLKPSNLLVHGPPEQARLKVIDFGLAKVMDQELGVGSDLTLSGQILGTPEYMSPEQAGGAGAAVDTLSDVYGLGAILYELVTGVGPLTIGREAGLLAMLQEIHDGKVPVPSARVSGSKPLEGASLAKVRAHPSVDSLARELRGEIDWIVTKALTKEKEQRYASARDLGADLARMLAHLPVVAGPPTVWYRAVKFLRRNRTAAIAGATGIGILMIASPVVAYSVGKAALAQSRFDVMGDRAWLAQLRTDAEETLWPAIPSRIGDFEEWLAKAEWLAGRLPGHVQELRQSAAVDSRPQADGNDYSESVVRRSREQLVREIGAFAAPTQGLFTQRPDSIDSVRKRLAWAREVERVTLHEAKARWNAARTAIAEPASPYRGLVLEPQSGLDPIGPDPKSGLWEFRVVTPGGQAPERGADGRLCVTPDTDMVLVLIPGGKVDYAYGLGSFRGNGAVQLEPFFLSKFECTQAQWQRITGRNPSAGTTGVVPEGMEDTRVHPVQQVTCADVKVHLARLELTLPTEAQWVHAARGGTGAPYWPALQGVEQGKAMNVADQSTKRLQPRYANQLYEGEAAPFDDGYALSAPVDSLIPNPFGLHHVIGNVWEMCLDAGAASAPFETRASDGLRTYQGVRDHVVRGGSCRSSLASARIDARLALPFGSTNSVMGFRAARAVRKLESR